MKRKSITTSKPKGEITEPKLVVEKTEDVDELIKRVGKLTYGQCSVLKIALDRRLAQTRARR